jgi:hypothetical protein
LLLQDPDVFENPDDSKSMAIQKTNLQVSAVFYEWARPHLLSSSYPH